MWMYFLRHRVLEPEAWATRALDLPTVGIFTLCVVSAGNTGLGRQKRLMGLWTRPATFCHH